MDNAGLENKFSDEVEELRKQVGELAGYKEQCRLLKADLRLANDRYRQIFENIQDIYYELLIDGTILEVSPSIEALSKYKREDLIGKSVYDTYFDIQQRADFINAITKEGKVYDYELTLKDRDGNPRPVAVSSRLVVDANGIPNKIVGIVRDIAVRKNAEEALREREEKYRELVQNANSIILRMDNNGVITFFNEFAQTFFGYTEKEIIGRNVVGTIVPEVESTGRDLRAMIHDIGEHPDKYVNNINENVKKNAETVWISWTNKASFDKTSRITDILCIGNDITDRKLAEDALQESNQFNREIIANANEGIIVYDKELRYVVWNRFMEELTNVRAADVIGKNALESFPHLQKSRINVLLDKALAGETVFSEDIYFHIPQTGKQGWYTGVYGPHYNSKNEIIGVVGIINDITNRKAMEEELKIAKDNMEHKVEERTKELRTVNEQLRKEIDERIRMENEVRETEGKFRDLVNLLPQLVFEIDQNLKFTFANKYAFDALGYSQQDLEKGITIQDVIIPDDIPRVLANIKESLDGGKKFSGNTYTVRKADGTTFPAIVYSSPIIRKDKTVGLRGIVADITEQKKAEDVLRISEEKYRLLFENATDVIYSVDRSLTLISCSPSIEQMMGYKPEELIGRKINDLGVMTQEYLEKSISYFVEVIAGKHVIAKDIEFIAKNGSKRIGEVSATPLYKNGEVIAVMCIARDITERKNAEALIKKREQELEEKSNALIEANAALKVLIRNIEEEKNALQEKVLANLKELVSPYINKLKNRKQDSSQVAYINIIEGNLEKIMSPFLHKLTSKYLNFTKKELQVALLIKDGKTTKEISELLTLSSKTIDCHRNRIRKKLGLNNKKTNLQSYLVSLN
jgi:PAS domain S-box-containing protein